MNSKRLDGCSFITGSFQKIEDCVLEGSIDTVLFIEVIEHLKNIAEARIGLGVIHDKLKSGGRLVVATPNFGGFMGSGWIGCMEYSRKMPMPRSIS